METRRKEDNPLGRLLGFVKRLNIGIILGVAIALCAFSLFAGRAVAADGDEHAVSGDEQTSEHMMQISASDYHALKANTMSWAFLAAAIATGLGSIAAGYAVSGVGAAAMGAVAEKPELMGKSLIYVALAEGIAIYGLLMSIVILSKV